ncbi:ABA4-like family protein [Nodosilinea nodulosa]|uniref:ABA4-like family protein n=1 Tax=Nodosilinea nodulosa TaxID=416001 RepID=UPI00030BB0F4|nr:ABA4-like family protein [Nodosilinea nodulosa]
MTVDAPLLDLLFTGANLFVLPFWTLMVLVPNTKLTRTVMGSLLPFAALTGLYLFLFVTSFSNVEGIEGLSDPNLGLSDLAALFANPHVTATGWVHYLVFDLFVGRWIYWQGQESGVFTRHSCALCLFAGPLGLLSHLLTDALWKRFAGGNVGEAVG